MNGLLLALLLASSQQHAEASNKTCVKAISFLEARGEGAQGIKAVRQVIANRARESGSSECKVVTKKRQFSSYKPGMNLGKIDLDKQFLEDWEKSSRMSPVLSKEHTYFYKKGSKPAWSKGMNCNTVIKNHVFCKSNKEE